MPECPHPHIGNLGADLECDAMRATGREMLLCWLTKGHDGPHWDDVDRVHWTGTTAVPCADPAVTL